MENASLDKASGNPRSRTSRSHIPDQDQTAFSSLPRMVEQLVEINCLFVRLSCADEY